VLVSKAADRTVLLITHRLASVRSADRIYVLTMDGSARSVPTLT
jgi:ABC-type multidrug transport system fused ATPase/permease subunit